jgi:multiple sugar transport system substrate-binding protein
LFVHQEGGGVINRPSKERFQYQLDNVIATLRQEIIDGTYAPQSYLPSEMALSKRFQFSNKSIRKGLEVLEEAGFIRKIPRVGNQVQPLHPHTTLRFNCSRTILRDLQLEKLIDDFHQLYPRIQIETVPYYRPVPEVLSSEHSEMDLISVNNHQFQELVKQGLAETFAPLPQPEETHPLLLEPFRDGGTLRAQPLVFGPVVLCYNKAHFEECGIPEPDGSWTWDQLFRSATALSNGAGRYGFGFHAISENRWPIFLLQSGSRSEWEAPWESEALRRKLAHNMSICKNILHDRAMSPLYLSQDDKEINRLFREGKISMLLASYPQLNDFLESGLDFDVSPVPFQYDPATLFFSIGAAVNRYSEHKEEAMLFLQYMASQRAQEIIQAHSLSLPSCRRLWERPVAGRQKRPDRYAMFREILFTFRTHHDLFFSESLRLRLLSHLKEYWADMIDVEQLCDRIFSEIRADRAN